MAGVLELNENDRIGVQEVKTVAILGTRGYPSFYGGFETAVRKLAPFLADHGWDVSVYGRPSGDREKLDADERVVQVNTKGLNTQSLSTLSYGLTSALHAAINKPDVALVMNVANGFWLPILKLRGIRTLVNVDGMEWERAKWGRLAKKVFLLGAKFTAKWADEIVVDAEAIGQRWANEFARVGIFIPYGGDIPAARNVEPGLKRRGYVLVVARFVPENSIQEFFDAVPALAARWPVVIVGSSGFKGEFDIKAAEMDASSSNVHWLGHMKDDARLFSLWQNAGAYFHGHSVGGTNPALVQAMACGAPIVARDTVYNREVLGDAGAFVLAESTEIIAGISSLMEDNCRQETLSHAAISRATQSYSWESVCSKYECALEALRTNVVNA